MTVDVDPHRRLCNLQAKYGSDEEKATAREMLELLAEGEQFGSWGPLTELKLPSILVTQCEQTAQFRYGKKLRNRRGMRRDLSDERRTVEAQCAACIMLGLPFNFKMEEREGRQRGNVGNQIHVNCPRPMNQELLIEQSKPKSHRYVLLRQWDDHEYIWEGWAYGKDVMLPQYAREFSRVNDDGVSEVSRPYIVPVSMLSTPETWQ